MRKIILALSVFAALSANTAYAATADTARSISAGASEADVRELMGGSPYSVSTYGEREIYILDDGTSAILHYIDNAFDMGFILV